MSALTASGGSAGYAVYTSSGSTLKSGSVTSQNRTILLPVIPATGTYFVLFSATATGVQLTAALENDAQLPIDASSLNVAGATAQSKRMYFTATAGQNIGVGLRNLALIPSNQYVQLTVYSPNNSSLGTFTCYQNTGGCNLALRNVPSTGTYTIVTVPSGGASSSYRLTLSEPVTGSLTIDTPQGVSIPVEGQFAIHTFSVTAGQTVALEASSISTTPTGKSLSLSVYGPTGALVFGTSGTSQIIRNLTNLAAGTYTVVTTPYYGVTADFQLLVATGITGSLQVDGTSTAIPTTLAGQNAYFTFEATAGENVGIGIRNLLMNPASNYLKLIVYAPSGSQLSLTNDCYQQKGGCGMLPPICLKLERIV